MVDNTGKEGTWVAEVQSNGCRSFFYGATETAARTKARLFGHSDEEILVTYYCVGGESECMKDMLDEWEEADKREGKVTSRIYYVSMIIIGAMLGYVFMEWIG